MKWSLEITASYPGKQCWSKIEESDAHFGDNQGSFSEAVARMLLSNRPMH